MKNNYMHSELTNMIISAFYEVYNQLGFGFLENVYEKALLVEFKKMGLIVEEQKPIRVYYDNEEVGIYYADLVVNNLVIIEVKATKTLNRKHEIQLVNYLKATRIEVGLLMNFGDKPAIKRKVFTNRVLNY